MNAWFLVTNLANRKCAMVGVKVEDTGGYNGHAQAFRMEKEMQPLNCSVRFVGLSDALTYDHSSLQAASMTVTDLVL